MKVQLGNQTFLIDPWLQDKGMGFSASTHNEKMVGVKSPLNDMPFSAQEVLKGVDFCLVSHVHPDHFTSDYLPKSMKIIVPTFTDKEKILKMGFDNVEAIQNNSLNVGDIRIIKTPARHGDNEAAVKKMGDCHGYLIEYKNQKLYFAGDTIFYEVVENIIKNEKPEAIIINTGDAANRWGRLIMNLEDVEKVCKLSDPSAKVIAVHLDSVNHGRVCSEHVKALNEDKNLNHLLIPENGKIIKI